MKKDDIDIVIRTVKSDKDAKYKRMYEIAYTLTFMNTENKLVDAECRMEIASIEGSEVDECSLLSKYIRTHNASEVA